MNNSIPILTVSQLTNAIKHCLEPAFPQIWLQGEISNLKIQTSGHLYFSLKDSHAQIAAVMFRGSSVAIKTMLKDGAQVMVFGEINIYPPSGRYQMIVRELRLIGIGELLAKLEQLKIELQKRGWFAVEHKKPLPSFPKWIGVVTSPTGAAIHDILNVLSRRFSGFKLLLNPVRVQGEGAASEIAQAIDQFNRYQLVDVIIVGRGGGSIEDLWAFNEEIVAKAIYTSRIPVISAVGHETDICISDFVADVRAPTPSAAAMMVIAEKEQLLERLEQLHRRLQLSIRQQLRHEREKLNSLRRQPLLALPYSLLGPWMQRCDELRQQIELAARRTLHGYRNHLETLSRQLALLNPTARLKQYRQRLEEFKRALDQTAIANIDQRKVQVEQSNEKLKLLWVGQFQSKRQKLAVEAFYRQLEFAINRSIEQRRERVGAIGTALKSIDPQNLLRRGYAILFEEKKDSAITSVKAVQPHQNIRLRLIDGELLSTINEVVEK